MAKSSAWLERVVGDPAKLNLFDKGVAPKCSTHEKEL